LAGGEFVTKPRSVNAALAQRIKGVEGATRKAGAQRRVPGSDKRAAQRPDEATILCGARNDLTTSTSLDEGIGGFLNTVKAMGQTVQTATKPTLAAKRAAF